MKRLLLSSIVSLLLPLPATYADVAVYSGSAVVKTTSQAEKSTKVHRIVEVVDLATGDVVTLTLTKSGNAKTATASDPVNFLITQVADARTKKTATVLAHAATNTDADTGVTSVDSSTFKGANSDVVLKTGAAAIALPKNVHGTGSFVAGSGTDPNDNTAIAAASIETFSVLKLEVAISKASNDAGEILSEAVDRVKAALEAAH